HEAKWAGIQSVAELTKLTNPSCGYVHTANEFNLPEGSARERMIGFEWTEASRSQRIKQCFDNDRQVTLADALALQIDKKSLIALRVMAFVRTIAVAGADIREMIDRLSAWDGVLDPESREAALFEVWYVRYLKPALVSLAAGRDFAMSHIDNEALCDFLESLQVGGQPAKCVVEQTLRSALAEIATHDARLGRPAAWGDLVHAVFPH